MLIIFRGELIFIIFGNNINYHEGNEINLHGWVDGWVDEGWGGWVGPERRTSLQCMSRDTRF